jgi:serine phosphatase RsbU (regulator of sigma subunit)
MAQLRELNGERTYPLSGKVTVLGRDPRCDVVVSVGQVSSWHALIVNLGGEYYTEDLHSLNGTQLNGQLLQQRTRLAPGDRLDLPGIGFTFEVDRPEAPSLPSTEALSAVVSAIELARGPLVQVAPEAKLRAVLEISQHLGAALTLDTVLPKLLEALFSIFPQADQGFILLRSPATGQMVPKAVRHRGGKDGQAAFSRTVIEHALSNRQAILSTDAGSDARFNRSASVLNLRLRSVMCVPLLGQDGTPLGIIQLDTQNRKAPFRQEDLDVLLCASTQAAQAVELARLHEERRDLEAATRIQKSFLPSRRPDAPGLRFYDYYVPAQHVGGDYFDYIPLPGGRLAVALGDVSGKGVSAALLMARLSAAVRFGLATAPSVAEAVRRLNAILPPTGPDDDRYITFLVAVLDLEKWSMTLVNAGHMPPLRRQPNGSIEQVADEVVGLPLAGIDMPYTEAVVPLQPGDTFLLYTDGVTEARNPAGAWYGLERLRAAVAAAAGDPESVGSAVVADVHGFAASRPQGDDLTVVAFGRTG